MRSKVLIGLIFLLASCIDDSIVPQSEQLKKDIAAIDKYLLDNGITNVLKDASGVRMVITTVGDAGLPPNEGNNIEVDYTGRLMSTGSIFDDGTVNGRIGDYIYGWQICLPMLPEGSIARLYIPSTYAYGSQGNSGIPPNENLIFDVELVSVSSTAAQETKLASDGVFIDDYLNDHSLTATTHPTGLRYEIISQGTGATPGLYDQIEVNYVGKIMPNENEFGSGTIEPVENFSSRLINFLPGWQVGLPMIQEGGKIRLYIPSGLGYGNIATPNIPANSNLFFELELVDVR